MEELTLVELARKYEEAWDLLTDLREELQEIKQAFEDELGDAGEEITGLRLEIGGYCKIIESLVHQGAGGNNAELPSDVNAG